MRYRSNLIKVSVVTIGFVVATSLLGWYIVPDFFFGYASGIVDHKMIGYTLDGNLKLVIYTVSVRLSTDDTLNNFSRGTTFAYIVSESDWERVHSGGTVKIKILPHLQAQLV
ncbi:hypothetical protein MUP77_18205 [Candidatus Bathyarchaeota archaeon]|nr:hypothetical protein [Candidatus Bathyarchaeota archaeon]